MRKYLWLLLIPFLVGTTYVIDRSNDDILIGGPIRGETSLYISRHRFPIESSDPGASGATWTDMTSDNLPGYSLDNSGEILEFAAPVLNDWDEASDLTVNFNFQVDDATTSNGDTADLALTVYYMGNGDSTLKTQTIAENAVTTNGTQWRLYQTSFTIDYDYTDNVVEIGDKIGFELHMETDTSEVDSILIIGGALTYNTKHIGLEN